MVGKVVTVLGALLTVVVLATMAWYAFGPDDGPVTAVSPADGATIARGGALKIMVHAPAGGPVYLEGSSSPRLNDTGTFPDGFTLGRMTAGDGDRFTYTADAADVTLGHAGRFYWHAYREICEGGKPCTTDGVVRAFTVR
jgi:hypothetical protein